MLFIYYYQQSIPVFCITWQNMDIREVNYSTFQVRKRDLLNCFEANLRHIWKILFRFEKQKKMTFEIKHSLLNLHTIN